jgi:hypothetical protein
MFRSRAARSIIAAAAFVLCFSLVLIGVTVTPAAKAEPQDALARLAPAKADRLPATVKGAPCSALSWPYYEQRCLFDRTRVRHEAGGFRVIAMR